MVLIPGVAGATIMAMIHALLAQLVQMTLVVLLAPLLTGLVRKGQSQAAASPGAAAVATLSGPAPAAG